MSENAMEAAVGFNSLPDELIGEILNQLPPFTVLRLRMVCKVWKRVVEEVISALDFQGMRPTMNTFVRVISALGNLRHLCVSVDTGLEWRPNFLTDDYIRNLRQICPELRTLLAPNCTQLTDNGIVQIASFPHLATLDISRSVCSYTAFDALLSKCSSLTRLDMGSWQGYGGDIIIPPQLQHFGFSEYRGAFHLEALDTATSLTSLNLHGVAYMDAGALMSNLQQTTGLKSLDLRGVFRADEKEIIVTDLLKQCAKLEELWLSGGFIYRLPTVLGNYCPLLRLLSISGAYRMEMPSLRHLLDRCEQLVELHITACGTAFNSQVLHGLIGSHKLKILDLGMNENIADNDLCQLLSTVSLEELHLPGVHYALLNMEPKFFRVLAANSPRLRVLTFANSDFLEFVPALVRLIHFWKDLVELDISLKPFPLPLLRPLLKQARNLQTLRLKLQTKVPTGAKSTMRYTSQTVALMVPMKNLSQVNLHRASQRADKQALLQVRQRSMKTSSIPM
eukprot:TRINITY_DN18_c0_g1_i2.p1 TRINITY_DN18_c0_g1~~TRINITY_DN18_c0_g1_i2.p1  ORF type:complete len:529 (-),score=81.96 TRINITY_DN18_c0_g1_i2:744-2264(-)